MVREFQYNQIVAPMKEIWLLWEREKKVTLPWFFETLQGLASPRPIIHFVDLDSTFFQALHREFRHKKFQAEYLILAEHFFKSKSLLKLLEEGVHLSLLIFKPLGPEIIEKIKAMENFMAQLKFVILARRDWNFENTYRSIPHFMRSRLYVDFPVSVRQNRTSRGIFNCGFLITIYEKFGPGKDPFLLLSESVSMVGSFREQFPENPLRSYCPNLFFYNEYLSPNVSHFDIQGGKTGGECRLSIILENLNFLETVMHSEIMAQNFNQVEILIRTDGKSKSVLSSSPDTSFAITGDIPSYHSSNFLAKINDSLKVSIRHCLVYPRNSKKSVSKALVNNLLAGQSRGEYLLFLDKETEPFFEILLDAFFKKSFDEFEFLNRKGVMIFRRDDFLKIGGFDILFTDKLLLWFDSSFRYNLFKNRDFNFEETCLFDSLNDGDFGTKKKSKNFKTQWNMILHKYVCEEKFKFCFKKINEQRNLHREFLKIILTPVSTMGKLCNKFKNIWNSWFYKIYSLVFCFFYPVRKIYYFCEFQYEKRILGLHAKDKSEPDS